jgi:ketosteroid isomerase-like protein
MRKIGSVLAVTGFLLAGCVSAPDGSVSGAESPEQAQIRRRLDEVIAAAEKKELDRLESYHWYGPKFTKFTTENPARQDAEVARKGERDGITAAQELVMRANDLKIDVFGNTGVATFILDYSFKAGAATAQKKARSTLVFVKDSEQWRIVHEHLSQLP